MYLQNSNEASVTMFLGRGDDIQSVGDKSASFKLLSGGELTARPRRSVQATSQEGKAQTLRRVEHL